MEQRDHVETIGGSLTPAGKRVGAGVPHVTNFFKWLPT
jgi:hypothetical protein